MPRPFEHNAQGDAPADALKCEELSNVIDMEGITYDRNTYLDEEFSILQPRLVAMGYTEIRWSMGDYDSFGPLTRVCTCRDASGELREFIYG
jgi:hypothetical protein